jgi:hypothetical protein
MSFKIHFLNFYNQRYDAWDHRYYIWMQNIKEDIYDKIRSILSFGSFFEL